MGRDKYAKVLINQLLLTTQPDSLLYYDEIDLLNVEDQAYAPKQGSYRTIWDLIDSGGVLHQRGNSGI